MVKTHTLPAWITPLKFPVGHRNWNMFIVDSDIIYPFWLKALGIETTDQYWLEIVMGCTKMDFRMHVGLFGAFAKGRVIMKVRADDGRKQRWNLTMHPPGEKDFSRLGLAERGGLIRNHYKKVRGFVPSG